MFKKNVRIDFFTQSEKKIKDLLLFKGDFILAGSKADPRLIYTSDYDFNQTLLKSKVPAKELVKELQSKVKKIKKAKNVYLGDVKAGESGISPIRWSSDDILKGFQMVKNLGTGKSSKVLLEKAINQKDTTFKIDIIAFLSESGGFHEFSNIIFRTQEKNEVRRLSRQLIMDFDDKMREEDYYKAIKRYFSFMNVNPEDFDEDIKSTLKVLNSPSLGGLHQINDGLKSLIFLVESNKVKIKSVRFKEELEGFKKWLWTSFNSLFDSDITKLLTALNKLLKSPSLEELKGYQEQVAEYLNSRTLFEARRAKLFFIDKWFEDNKSVIDDDSD